MPCAIKTSPRFRKCIAGKEADALAAMQKVQEGFGRPHVHAGFSIRKIAPDVFECRTDLKTRLVFIAQKGILTFDFAGNHRDVQNYLRGR
ncbi:MAG TPA: hypothetical protein VMV89_04305 [Candidatus Paceibacterota bacterium]|nr:hypothetical protein [Candidatus Paceibacterota bacterium]